MIMIGDRRTRKKDVVERLFRQQLTEEAMRKMEKKKIKEERRSAQIERSNAQIDRSSSQIDCPVPYGGTWLLASDHSNFHVLTYERHDMGIRDVGAAATEPFFNFALPVQIIRC